MKTILVPTDFSNPATNALKFAIAIARKINAKIRILHIYNIPVMPGSIAYLPYPDEVQENIKSAEQQLENLPLQLPELKMVTYETKTVPGYWAMEIPEIIQDQNADLTVMGTKGASGLKEVVIGSNTASVIDGAKHPVLVIPEQAQYKGISNIGFAYDHEPVTDKLKMLIVIAKLFNADVQIFHIKEKDENDDGQIIPENSFKEHFGAVNYNYSNFYGDDIEDGINKYIETKNIDILAMVPRKYTIFYRLFKNSLTKKMAFHIKIPLLAIPE